MTHFIRRNLNQDITYWPPENGSQTNDFGHATFDGGILIKGRWEDRVQNIRKPNGDEVVSMAEVMVDTDVEVDGYLALGDYTSQDTPTEGAREIQDVRKTPDLRNLATEIRAFL